MSVFTRNRKGKDYKFLNLTKFDVVEKFAKFTSIGKSLKTLNIKPLSKLSQDNYDQQINKNNNNEMLN